MPAGSARVTAATPNADLVRYMDWWTGLYEEPFRVEKRKMIISDKPGFGLEPSKAVRKALDIS